MIKKIQHLLKNLGVDQSSEQTPRVDLESIVKPLEQCQVSMVRQMVRHYPSMAFAKDIRDQYRFVAWNSHAEKITGVTEESCIGKTDYDFFTKDQADFFRSKDIAVAESQSQIVVESEEIKTSEGIKLLKTTKFVVLDSDDQPSFLVGYSEDVTDKMNLQLDLQRTLEEFEHFFAVSNEPMVMMNRLGEILKVNRSGNAFFSSSSPKSRFLDCVHPEDLPVMVRVLKNIDPAGDSLECRVRNRSGIYQRVRWNLLSDPSRQVIYASGYDVTSMRDREAELTSVMDAINRSAIVAVTDRRGVIIEVNDLFSRISGYSRPELLGKTHQILNSGLHPRSYFTDMWRSILSGRVWSGEIQNRRKDGTNYIVHTVIAPIRNVDGDVHRFIAIRFDLTKERETEKLLREAQAVAKIGSWSFDLRNGRITWTDEMFELFHAEHRGVAPAFEQHFNSIHEEDRGYWKSVVDQAMSSGQKYKMRFRSVFPDGKVLWIEAHGQPRLDEDQKIVGLSGTCQDVTELVEAEDKIRSERAKALHISKLSSLGEMSAGIAHEINNPLTIILGQVRLLGKALEDPSSFASKVSSIEKAGERIAKIVKGLKKFSRTHEKADLRLRSLSTILREVRDLIEPKARRDDVSVVLECPDDLHIICDDTEIEQVFINLINNGIDAAKGSVGRCVEVSAEQREDQVVVQVQDSGEGIPSELRGRLFQPFFTTKAVGEGTGLGLAIVKGILDEHSATITINETTKKTCFEVVFPSVNIKDERSA